MTAVLVMTTCPSEAEADALAQALVRRKLAACVQAVPVRSTYVWESEVQHDAEVLLLIKAPTNRAAEIELAIGELHSYEVPEIVTVDITGGSPRYLDWLVTTTR